MTEEEQQFTTTLSCLRALRFKSFQKKTIMMSGTKVTGAVVVLQCLVHASFNGARMLLKLVYEIKLYLTERYMLIFL